MLTCEPFKPENRSMLTRGLRILICLLILFPWCTWETWAQNNQTDTTPLKKIRFAVLHDIYSNVTRQDARTALELIMQKTIVQKSYPYVVEINLLDKTGDIVNTIQQGGYHFVTLSGIDYFSYREALKLTPVLIPSKSDHPTETLLFLVKTGQTLTSIARKAQRTLILENGRCGDLSLIWLDKMLATHHQPQSKRFFTHIRRVKKPARAVLPVFFNQADACVVTRNTIEVMQELNPQIGRRIQPLFLSKGLVRRIICATPKPDPADIEAFVRESVNIDHNADTRQAMMIIQTKRFHPISIESLEATLGLLLRPTP